MKNARRVNPVAKGITDLEDGRSAGKMMSTGLLAVGANNWMNCL